MLAKKIEIIGGFDRSVIDKDDLGTILLIRTEKPSKEEIDLALIAGFKIIHDYTINEFTITPEEIYHTHGGVEVVAVDNPVTALRLSVDFIIGVFEKIDTPSAKQVSKYLHLYDMF